MSLPPIPAWQMALLKWAALHLPWTKGIKTAPENDQHIRGTPPKDWANDKAALLEWVERVAAGQVEYVTHPLLGKMNKEEWQRWGYLHCDHHLRQFGV
jgi:hypothetical protein